MSGIIETFREKGITSREEDNLLLYCKYNILAQRKLIGEPIEYINGYTTFLGNTFLIDSRVYIPTSETEFLAQKVMKELSTVSSVLDVGTGSGALAITIKRKFPRIPVYGSDLNRSSLEIAQLNAKKHNVHIEFFESSYVDNVDIPEPTHIVANLPWGNNDHILHSNINRLNYMPHSVYFHPSGPLAAYEELIDSIQKKSWHPILFIETGSMEKDAVKKIIPNGENWEYIPSKNYSITKIQL